MHKVGELGELVPAPHPPDEVIGGLALLKVPYPTPPYPRAGDAGMPLLLSVVEDHLCARSKSFYSLLAKSVNAVTMSPQRLLHTTMHVDLINPPLAKAIVRRHVGCSHPLFPFEPTQHARLPRRHAAFRLLQCLDWHRVL